MERFLPHSLPQWGFLNDNPQMRAQVMRQMQIAGLSDPEPHEGASCLLKPENPVMQIAGLSD